MKQFFKTMALIAFFMAWAAPHISAQSADFYWAEDQRIDLYPDHTSLMVHFEGSLKAEDLTATLEANPAVKEVDFFTETNQAVIHFNEKQAVSASALAKGLGLDGLRVRSAHYGYALEDGFQMWLTHKIVLRMKPGLDFFLLSKYLGRDGARFHSESYGNILVEVDDIGRLIELANAIQTSGMVEYSHPDFYAPITRHADPLYPEQFQMHNTGQTIDGYAGLNDVDIDAPEAWAITTGSASVIVGVIDDGMEAHEDMNDGGGNSRIIGGYTPLNGGNGTAVSGSYHAVPCAGIIGASHNNIGVRGAAPQSRFLTVNIFAGAETATHLATAFNWVVSNGAWVISNSWGYNTCTENLHPVLTNAINNAAANGRGGLGCPITFSTGNNYKSCVNYPANTPSVISVGAVTNQGVRSAYSNYGTGLDVVAPSNGAAGVRTTDRMGSPGYSAGNYTGVFGGTSAACPAAAGVAALVLAVNPGLTGAQVKSILETTATDMGPAGWDSEYGNGRVSAYDAVLAALPCDAPGGLNTSNITGSGATASWNAAANASNYDLRYRPAGGSYTQVNGIAATSYNLAGLSSNTSYEWSVRSNCASGTSSWSATATFMTDLYCSAGGSSSAAEWIDLVKIGAIDNATGSNGGYANFSNLSATVTQGATYTFNFSKGSPSLNWNYWRVYVDWNQDGDFNDSGEQEVSLRFRQNDVLTSSISVPANATLGNTRMRVMMKKNSWPSPCEIYASGETEDYTLNVVSSLQNGPAPSVAGQTVVAEESVMVSPNPASHAAYVRIDVQGQVGQAFIADMNGRMVQALNPQAGFQEVQVAHLPEGVYLIVVKMETEILTTRFVKTR